MAPIRVALIGLSATAITTWASDAHLPYLLSTNGKSHYQIIALLNSSVAAAEAAKSHFHLPPSTKTYGSPADLAADLDVDLVVCSTRVDTHFPTIAPSLKAGKAVFVEWPLAANLAQALELLTTANGEEYSKNIVGLQGRVSPVTLRIQSILAAGTIGTVLSSTVHSFGSLLPRDAIPESMLYFTQRAVGGNAINIENGHSMDYILHVLGGFAAFESRMQIQRGRVRVLGKKWDGEEGDRSVETDVPDLLSIHGSLEGRQGPVPVVDGALLTLTFRTGPPFKGQPALTWSINGTRGELLITVSGRYLHSHVFDDISIKHHDHASDEVRELGWEWEDWQRELPVRARATAELYERYAEWVEGGKGAVREGREWPGLRDGVERLRMFEGIYRQFDESW
ncbi:oxidoreductase family protein [Byssothecium circinans]|uniref:Oxidoreductase family protein n=1 Tax=Byssothecium circinans TaxID=147558 RepID=A0A6A5TF68_9PLEO|nr:oxidoreductase family protein [Byssothecium circinans]